ncbi:MAG: PadR family transcriptional regulator [Mobilicoccus sp.]|nr:PadR family transcriptional regulator [Mobilicoccus sp.]
MYPLLSRLRKEELVTTTWRESDAGPARRYYRLSPAGAASLGAFRTAWTTYRTSVEAVLFGPSRREPS